MYPVGWDVKDADGAVLMHLRDSPRATLRPGQRVHVISCICKPGNKRNKCRTCECGKHDVTCSVLCKCTLSCWRQRIPWKSHTMKNGQECKRELSTLCDHRGGDVATVARDRPEGQQFLSNGITGDVDDLSER